MKLLSGWRHAWSLLRENSRLQVLLNLLFFICVGVGWSLQSRNPGLEESIWTLWQEGGDDIAAIYETTLIVFT